MSNPQLRKAALRLSSGLSRRSVVPALFSAIPQKRQFSVKLQKWQELGYVDDKGLTIFDTLHEMQVRSCQTYGENPIFGTYSPESQKFEWMTFADYEEKVNKCRAVLKDLGVTEFSKVGIISNNRWEWATIAAASYSLNASIVPMYEAQLAGDWTYILNDSGSTALFCATQEIFDQVHAQVLPSTPMVKSVLCLDAPEGEAHAFATQMANAPANSASLIIEPTQEDLADLIYTSGTTGKPKGVELTHHNLTSNVKSAVRTMVEDPSDFVRQNDVSLAFLPWAHSYGQTCELWAGIAHGASAGICRGIPHILEDLQLVKPTVLFSVPTLYKRIYDGVHNLMETSSPLRKKLMKKALYLGRQNAEANHGLRAPLGVFENLQFKALDSIVLSKIRDRFGGRLRHGFVAGAATPSEVLDFMDNLSIPVCEGYGLTETSPIICLNTPENRKVGSVGKAIGGVTVYIIGEDGKPVENGKEGEICCTGPNIMRGYYNNKEATDEVISVAPDGVSRMFHTGDMGRMDDDGYIRVTGRLKEQYKLENGKYVVPTPIEEAIGMSRFISQCVLYGDNRPHNVVLIVPDWVAIRNELGIAEDVSEEELANDTRVAMLIDAEMQESCDKLKKFEVPTEWAIVAPFTAANNMLTPKMSIRRHKVVETYADLIASLYGDEEANENAEKQQVA
jgi:long-chain acyl-CoA synthetase